MRTAERGETTGGREASARPLPVTPNVGFQAPQTQERFELRGVCEELKPLKLIDPLLS